MTDQVKMTKAEFLAKLQQGWDEFHAYIATLSEAEITGPSDPAGWTTKDHVMHIVAWEDSMYTMLKGLPRREQMGIDAETWASGDYDRINEVIRQQYLDLSWAEVQQRFDDVHKRLLETLEPLSDEDLYRPFNSYQPGAKSEEPIFGLLTGNTYDHYAEHIPWIEKIVHPAITEPEPTTQAQLLAAMQEHWDELNTYLDTLSEAQATQATDAGGWTLKDHVIHMAMWENGMNGVLQKLPRREAMGVDEAAWSSADVEKINANMQQKNKDLSWAEVRQKFQQVHEELVGRIGALSEEDLQRPFNYFQPTSAATDPLIGRLAGTSYEHYAVQRPWIEALAKR